MACSPLFILLIFPPGQDPPSAGEEPTPGSGSPRSLHRAGERATRPSPRSSLPSRERESRGAPWPGLEGLARAEGGAGALGGTFVSAFAKGVVRSVGFATCGSPRGSRNGVWGCGGGGSGPGGSSGQGVCNLEIRQRLGGSGNEGAVTPLLLLLLVVVVLVDVLETGLLCLYDALLFYWNSRGQK